VDGRVISRHIMSVVLPNLMLMIHRGSLLRRLIMKLEVNQHKWRTHLLVIYVAVNSKSQII